MATLTSETVQTPALLAVPAVTKTVRYQIAIVGDGAAGITTAALLLKRNRQLDVAILIKY